MSNAYWISCYFSIEDEDRFDEYAKKATPAIIAGGGRFLARGRADQVYELGIRERIVVVEFESVAAATDTYNSAAYQDAARLLEGVATRDVRIIAGV